MKCIQRQSDTQAKRQLQLMALFLLLLLCPSRPRTEWPLFIIAAFEDSSSQCRRCSCSCSLQVALSIGSGSFFFSLQVSLRQIFPLSLFFAGANSHGSLPFRSSHHSQQQQKQQNFLPGAEVCSSYPFTVILCWRGSGFIFPLGLVCMCVLLLALFKLETLIIMAMSKLNSWDLPELSFQTGLD